jgi:hypothetical protein
MWKSPSLVLWRKCSVEDNLVEEEEIRSIQATRLTVTMSIEKDVKKAKCC